MIKILKVLKIFFHSNDQFSQDIGIVDYFLPVKLRRLIEFFFYFFILNHTLACLWAFIGTLAYPNWIVYQKMKDCSNIDIYFSSFYYTLASIYTIGYGDIHPTNVYEQYYNIALQSIGLFLYSYVISSMTVVLKKSKKQMMFNDKMNLFETIKIQYKLDYKLYMKIKRHLQHSDKYNQDERVSFLQTFPNSLKYRLISTIYSEILKFKLFDNANINFKARVVLNMKPVIYSKSEFVIRRGTFIEDIIFIKKGVLSLEFQYKSHLICINKLRLGEHFGEIDMLLDNESEFDLVIKSKYAELLLLSKENVIDIGHEFPTLFNKIKKKSLANYTLLKQMAKQRMRQIDLSNLDNQRAAINNDKDILIKGLDIEDHELGDVDPNNNNDNVVPCDINNIIEEELIENEEGDSDSQNDKNDLSVHQIENELKSMRCYSSEKTYKRTNMKTKTMIRNKQFLSIKELDHRLHPRRSSQCLLQDSRIGKYSISKHISHSPNSLMHSSNIHQNQSTKSMRYMHCEEIKIASRGELLPKRKASCSLKNLETVNNLKEMKIQSTKIKKMMREGSMTINDPSAFYGKVFDKWQIDNQIRRID